MNITIELGAREINVVNPNSNGQVFTVALQYPESRGEFGCFLVVLASMAARNVGELQKEAVLYPIEDEMRASFDLTDQNISEFEG